jgi:hypothetical protein
MNIPQIQISQTPGRIAIEQNLGGVEMEQPHAIMNMKSVLPPLQIDKIEDKLEIDQSRAWAALGSMSAIETRDRIYSQVKSLSLQYIAKVAQKGDQLADIRTGANVIAELAKDTLVQFPEMNYVGEASIDNVDISYQQGSVSFRSERAYVDMQVEPRKPIIRAKPASVNITMQQYPHIEISVVGQNVDRSL